MNDDEKQLLIWARRRLEALLGIQKCCNVIVSMGQETGLTVQTLCNPVLGRGSLQACRSGLSAGTPPAAKLCKRGTHHTVATREETGHGTVDCSVG